MLANLQPQVGSFISYTARLCPNSFPIFLQTPLIFKLAWDGIFFLISLSEIVSYIRNAAKWPCHMIPLIQESWTFWTIFSNILQMLHLPVGVSDRYLQAF